MRHYFFVAFWLCGFVANIWKERASSIFVALVHQNVRVKFSRHFNVSCNRTLSRAVVSLSVPCIKNEKSTFFPHGIDVYEFS
jgi:hypothetical protein